jgi:hypothetical protein
MYAGLGIAGYYIYNSLNNGAVGTGVIVPENGTAGSTEEEKPATGDTYNLPGTDLSSLVPYLSGGNTGSQTKKEISSSSTPNGSGPTPGPTILTPESTSESTSSTSNYASAKKDYSGIDPGTLSTAQKQEVQGQIMTDILNKPISADPLPAAKYETELYSQLNKFGPVDSGKSYEEVFGTANNKKETAASSVINAIQETSKKANSNPLTKFLAFTNPITAVPVTAKLTEEQLIKLTTNNPLSFNLNRPENTPQKETATAVSNMLNGGAGAAIVGPTTQINPLSFMPDIMPVASASSDSGYVTSDKTAKMSTTKKEAAQAQIMTAILDTPAASADVFSAAQTRTDLYSQLNALGPVSSNKSYEEVFGSSGSSGSTTKKAAAATAAPTPSTNVQKTSTSSSTSSTSKLMTGNSALAKYNRAAAAASKKKK